MRLLLRTGLVGILLLGATTSLRAQDRAGPLIEAARAQLDALRADSAFLLLQRSFNESPTPAQRVRAFTLLGLTELSRNNRPAALQAFQLALRMDGALRIDSLADLASDAAVVFGDARTALGIGNASQAARAQLTVDLTTPGDTTVPASGGALRIETHPTYHSRVVTTVTPADAPSMIVWSDTQDVGGIGTRVWNLRDRSGAIVASNRYALRARAIDSTGQVSPDRERILIIARAAVDATPMPPALLPTAFAPETLVLRRGSLTGLLAGIAIAAGAAFVPSALGNASLSSGASHTAGYAVAGAVGVATIVGFLKGTRVQPMPANAAANAQLRQRDAAERQRIGQGNARALENAAVHIRLEGSR